MVEFDRPSCYKSFSGGVQPLSIGFITSSTYVVRVSHTYLGVPDKIVR